MVTTITHGELQNGDLNWREGYLFRVENLRRLPLCAECHGSHGHHFVTCRGKDQNATREVVRFEGRVVDAGASIARTGYDGGTYGAWADVPTVIELRDNVNRGRR